MGERGTAAGEFFRWRPAGVGRRAIPCPRCGGARTAVRLLDNLLEALCDRCGRNLALERARVVERDEGAAALVDQLRKLGAIDSNDAPPGAPPPSLDALLERGALRRDLRLTLDLDLDARAFAYGAAPLRDLVLPEEVERALDERRARGGVLNDVLRERVLERLGASIRSVGLDVGLDAHTDPRAIDPACRRALPPRALEVYRAVPVRREDGALVIALWDPLDEDVVGDLQSIVDVPVHAILAAPDALATSLADLGVRPREGAEAPAPDPDEIDGADEAALDLSDPFTGILLEALEEGASEVLVEPRGARASLRFRVRGELRKEREVAHDVASTLADRLCELAHDPSPDDAKDAKVRVGHARCEVSGLPVALDFRILGTALGPSVAIELEAEDAGRQDDLSHLGLSLDALAAFEAVIARTGAARAGGIIVVAGPPRGGKTAAYYAILERATRLGGAVLSLERRSRRALAGVTQLDLEHALTNRQAMLHPAPDWLGVDGDVDDAIRLVADAALSGRAVVVTVTAPDARSALLRLALAGLPTPLLTSCVRVVLARRVVPRVCPRCRMARTTGSWVGLGCPACADQGTQGAIALAELVRPTGDACEVVPLPGSNGLAARALELVRDGDTLLEAVADLVPGS